MPKENEGLFSIKEFSQLTGIKQSTLRYYDKLGIFTPAYRGENGYRYYEAHQLIAVSVIDLLHGFGLKTSEIKSYIDHRTPQRVQTLFAEKQDTIDEEIKRLTTERNVVETYSYLITRGLAAPVDKLEIVDVPERRITVGPLNDFTDSLGYGRAFSHFYRVAKHYDIDLRFPVGGYFDDFEAFQKAPGQPAHFFSVDPYGKGKIPAGKYLVGYCIGSYGETCNLETRMARFLKKHELTASGPVYNVFLLDEISVVDPKDYLLEVFVQIR